MLWCFTELKLPMDLCPCDDSNIFYMSLISHNPLKRWISQPVFYKQKHPATHTNTHKSTLAYTHTLVKKKCEICDTQHNNSQSGQSGKTSIIPAKHTTHIQEKLAGYSHRHTRMHVSNIQCWSWQQHIKNKSRTMQAKHKASQGNAHIVLCIHKSKSIPLQKHCHSPSTAQLCSPHQCSLPWLQQKTRHACSLPQHSAYLPPTSQSSFHKQSSEAPGQGNKKISTHWQPRSGWVSLSVPSMYVAIP